MNSFFANFSKIYKPGQASFYDSCLLILILSLAFLVRIYSYSSFSLSNDELSALSRVRYNSFRDVIEFGVKPDGHPAGIQVFLYYLTHIFGNSAAVIRLPFVIFGTLSVYLLYFVGKNGFNKATALFAASAMAFLEFPVLYSQIARPYASGLFFVLLSLSLFILAFKKKKNKKNEWIYTLLFAVSLSLDAYNHYFSALLGSIIAIFGFFWIQKNQWKRYTLALVFSVLLFLPHLPITLEILKIGGVGEWLGKPQISAFPDHLYYIFNSSFSVILLFLTAIAILIFRSGFRIEKSRHRWYALLLFLLPFFIAYFYSLIVNPVLQNSVLLFSMPFLLLFLFSFISENTNYRPVLICFIVLLFFHSFVLKKYHSQQHFDEFKKSAALISVWEKKLGTDKILFLESINNPWYLEYYSHKKFPFQIQYIHSDVDLMKLKSLLEQSTQEYCIYFQSTAPNDMAISMIQSLFHRPLFFKKYGDFSTLFLGSKNGKEQFCHPLKVIGEDDFKEEKNLTLQRYRVFNEFNFVADYFPTVGNKFSVNMSTEIDKKAVSTSAAFVLSVFDKNDVPLAWYSAPFKYFAAKDSITLIHWTTNIQVQEKDVKLRLYVLNPEKDTLEIKTIRYWIDKLN